LSQRFDSVPGWPLVGALFRLGRPTGLVASLERLSKEFGAEEGVFELDLAGDRTVVCSNWKACQEVLALRPFKVVRSANFERFRSFADGVFLAEGHKWSKERRLMAPAFNAKNVSAYFQGIREVVASLMARISHDDAQHGIVNFSEILPDFSADVIVKVAFGHDLRALHMKHPEVADITRLFEVITMRMMSPLPFWRLPILGPLLDHGAAISSRLQKWVWNLAQCAPPATERPTLVRKLMEQEQDQFGSEELVGNLATLFMAGTDTTSNQLAWALYELSMLPDVQEEAAAEVRTKTPHGVLELADLEQLPLISAIWLESLRLRSVAPFVGLTSAEPFELAGRRVPAGTNLFLLLRRAQHQHADVRALLGNDMSEFRPKRWLKEGADSSTGAAVLHRIPTLDTIAFGHGARYCLGKGLADAEARLALAEILRHFRISPWDGPAMWEKTAFTQQPGVPVKLRLVSRT